MMRKEDARAFQPTILCMRREGTQEIPMWSMRRCRGSGRMYKMEKAQGRMADVFVGREFQMAASEQDFEYWKNIPTESH